MANRSGVRPRNGITVTGTGTATTPVDHVTITLGVGVRRADPGDAFRVAALTATTVLALLADHGVDSRSVRTSSLSLGPEWDYRDGQRVLSGYAARQEFTVAVEGLAGVDRMLTDVATRAGEGVTIDGISLTAVDPSTALAQARRGAFLDAASRAAQLAVLADRGLGRVEWIDEGGPFAGPEASNIRLMSARAETAPMPIAGGDTSVTVSLVVHFSFAD